MSELSDSIIQNMTNLPKHNCTGCMACEAVCPKNAISFQIQGGFYSKSISDSCIKCGLCELVCPTLHPIVSRIPSQIFSAQYKDTRVLLNSSSGAVFAGLAQSVLNDGGLVSGATIRGLGVIHEISDCDYQKFQGSKYLQSYSATVYPIIISELKRGKTVLFSGTPCQVAGLLGIAKIKNVDTTNLITLDVICHGVPSFSLISLFEKHLKKKIKRFISFRDKVGGWNSHYATTVEFIDDSVLRDDSGFFSNGFSGFKMLRNSCYHCPYKDIHRCSDITVGDLWGGHTNSDDTKGLSLLLVNSEKGESIINKVKNSFELCDIEKEKYWLLGNPNLCNHKNPYKYHPLRVLLNFNMRHLPSWINDACYCGAYDEGVKGLLLQKAVHFIDMPFDKLLRYERRKSCKKVLSDFSD